MGEIFQPWGFPLLSMPLPNYFSSSMDFSVSYTISLADKYKEFKMVCQAKFKEDVQKVRGLSGSESVRALSQDVTFLVEHPLA
jgi:hypothetical protein